MNTLLKQVTPLLVTVLMVAACSKTQPPAPTAQVQMHVYEVKGILRAVDFAEQTATVEHETIPGFMPAMTMPFSLKSVAEVVPLTVGNRIGFRLIVTDTTSWIEGIQRVGHDVSCALPVAPHANISRLKEGDAMPPFRLTDDQGREITREAFSGKPLFVTFIFTRCPLPNFCPLMSRNFSVIRTAVADDEVLAGQTRFLSISFDTEFDSSDVLHNYAKVHTQEHDVWRFASGSAAEVEKLTTAFSVYVQRDNGTFSHGLCTALVDQNGIIRKLWRGNNWNASEAVTALRELRPSLLRVAQRD